MAQVSYARMREEIERTLKRHLPDMEVGDIERVLDSYESRGDESYHTLRHVYRMLMTLRDHYWIFLESVPNSDAVVRLLELAIIYHDVVYEAGTSRGWNEAASAARAADDLAGYGYYDNPRDLMMDGVILSHLITATSDHTAYNMPYQWEPFAAVLVDLDLWSLADPPILFAAVTEQIFYEYRLVCTREEFDRGRAAWAEVMLARESIFLTKEGKKRETQARRNLQTLTP